MSHPGAVSFRLRNLVAGFAGPVQGHLSRILVNIRLRGALSARAGEYPVKAAPAGSTARPLSQPGAAAEAARRSPQSPDSVKCRRVREPQLAPPQPIFVGNGWRPACPTA